MDFACSELQRTETRLGDRIDDRRRGRGSRIDEPFFTTEYAADEGPIFDEEYLFDKGPLFDVEPIYDEESASVMEPVFDDLTIACTGFGFNDEPVLDEGPVYDEELFHDPAIYDEESAFSHDLLGGTTLVSIFGKAGTLPDARRVFDEMRQGNQGPGRTSLDWETRSSIALAAACGVEYIHSTSLTASHGNIKSSNVLLGKSYQARVSDNGLTTLVGPLSAPSRTTGYRAPEPMLPGKDGAVSDDQDPPSCARSFFVIDDTGHHGKRRKKSFSGREAFSEESNGQSSSPHAMAILLVLNNTLDGVVMRPMPWTSFWYCHFRFHGSYQLDQMDSRQTENGLVKHGSVVIAAITSCTNTSNPSVLLGAALVAKKACELGLEVKPWVKTSLAPGSGVVTKYLLQNGLQAYLNKQGFHLVGYGCPTCIGNSGDLDESVSSAIAENDVAAPAVLLMLREVMELTDAVQDLNLAGFILGSIQEAIQQKCGGVADFAWLMGPPISQKRLKSETDSELTEQSEPDYLPLKHNCCSMILAENNIIFSLNANQLENCHWVKLHSSAGPWQTSQISIMKQLYLIWNPGGAVLQCDGFSLEAMCSFLVQFALTMKLQLLGSFQGHHLLLIILRIIWHWDPGINSSMSLIMAACVHKFFRGGKQKMMRRQEYVVRMHGVAWGQATFCRGGSVTPGPWALHATKPGPRPKSEESTPPSVQRSSKHRGEKEKRRTEIE